MLLLNHEKQDLLMHVLDVLVPTRISRIPDKTVKLLSCADYNEQGYIISDIEVRLYQKKIKNGIYSIITFFVETDKGTIERIINEGYLGPNSLEEEIAYVTSHLVLSGIILNSIKRLDERIKFPHISVVDSKIQNMITVIKANGFLKNPEVENAIKNTPRHLFVPDEFVEQAYEDRPLPTKSLQVISQPSVVAKMTELLDIKNDNKILEIGCGSGWQSAILSKLVPSGKAFPLRLFQKLQSLQSEITKKQE